MSGKSLQLGEYWDETPAIIICSKKELKRIHNEIGWSVLMLPKEQEHGYVGELLGISVWLDPRFDNAVFIGGERRAKDFYDESP